MGVNRIGMEITMAARTLITKLTRTSSMLIRLTTTSKSLRPKKQPRS